MIVKNEAHIITGTLEHLLKYFTFDYWVISDTGSTDNTKELILDFFKKHKIPGELVEHPWEDFGTNRTKAFECAYNKTDYAFVWDADDEVSGDFKMPENLTHDSYKFIFGNYDGFRYSRHQLFNNRKRWCYRGVLHEYAACLEDRGPDGNVLGSYYFISGRRGDRSKDPQKYYKDALVLEKAIEKAASTGDQLINRYTFYCAQSYNSCNMHEKAIEFYKKCLTMDVWVQEKYVCCFEIYDQYEMLKKPAEGLQYLVESYKYDTTRVECIYRLVKYYCINGPVEAAYAYYTMIQNYYENYYNPATLSDKLFAKKSEYDFYLPYYMAIVAERTKHHDVMAKMYIHVFKNKFLVGEWWIRNFIFNMQFCVKQLPKTLEFLESMLSYIELAKNERVTFEDPHNQIIGRVIDQYRDLLAAPNGKVISPSICTKPRVMLTITTCKRLDLFTKTVNSILNMWTDVDQIDYFYCVDDNSSEEDRVVMQTQYPFFNYYMKSASERGHRESMNLIWSKLNELKPTYWIHLEDDWLFFKKEAYVSRAIQALETHESKQVHQVVFNRDYGLMYSDLERTGGLPLGPGLILHEKRDGIPGRNCGYWPHYSLQPSVTRTRVVLELGNYDSPNKFFERDYADRYHARGYMTAFFNSIYSIHIGKQHWEKDGKNAYALNEVAQFGSGSATSLAADGTMREHLDFILNKIRSGVPFGLIRPSDGERSVMLGETLTNCDKWTYTKGGTLQADLLVAVQTVDPNLYIGIPCNTCCKPWNCTPAIYKDFIETFKVPLAQRTYANIFGNSNWPIFSQFLKSYSKGFFVITSGTSESTLNIKGRHIINDRLVNTWDVDGPAETGRLLDFIAEKQGELILFSAGPLSKIWIPKCMKANPNNIYVDVGGAIDVFMKGASNRFYTDLNHPFAKEACKFASVADYQGYSSVFNVSIEGFNKCEDKAALFKSFRAQRTIYGFTENGDIGPDQEAVCLAKAMNPAMYDEYLVRLKDRKAVGYEGSTQLNAAYNNLDSRHIMMSVLLFTYLPEAVKTIVEVGGGYGNWMYLNQAKTFNKWITIDLPHVSELQKWYLSETGVNMDRWCSVSAYDYKSVESESIDLVIGSHSLSELSLELFEDYFQRVITKSKYFLYCYHNSRPSLPLINAKKAAIESQFKIVHSMVSEGGQVTNCLYERLIPKKNLIYMCAFGTEEYYKLLELNLISIKLFSKTDADFLVFTCKEFEERLKVLVAILELPLQIIIVDSKTPHEASSYKLQIFDYEKINDYSKLLYLDIDILVQGNLMKFFDLCKDDKLYAAIQGTIGSHHGLGASLFDFSKIDRNMPAINAGVLLFNNSPIIKTLFTTVNKHMSDMKRSNTDLPVCYEQPFVNYHAVSAGLFVPILDHIHLTHNTWPGHEIPISPLNSKILMNHFIGTPLNRTKITQEGYHMTHLLNSYKNIVKSNPVDASILYHKQYTWGVGQIAFELNGLLITTWSRTGTYEILNSHVVKASWSGFEHILLFNSDYTGFISIRISDINIGVDHTIKRLNELYMLV